MSHQSEEAKKLDPIKGLKPPQDGTAQYVTAKQILDSSKELVDRELAAIGAWLERTDHDENKLMGLALSGGGIRSATFSLGVLQALAKHDVLKKMDYLSTVSGGGYIGSSLSWEWHQSVEFGSRPAQP